MKGHFCKNNLNNSLPYFICKPAKSLSQAIQSKYSTYLEKLILTDTH